MNDISMLEELGLQEVSRKTHIEVKHLQWMVEKKFDKLNRINTLGFVKILSREYPLDLSEWVEEIEAYWAEHQQESTTVERMYIANSLQESKRRWPWVLILLLIGAAGAGWYFDAQKYLDLSMGEESEQNVSHLYTTTPVIEEARVNLETMVLEEENLTVVEDDPVIMVDEVDEVVVDESENEAEGDASLSEESVQEEAPLDENVTTTTAVDVALDGTYFIKPGAKIWVGVIYLDNMKRASFLTEENIIFDMTREQIVTTGHGKFELVKGEEMESFESEFPKRFHIKDNVITPITYQEFIEYNKGKPW